MASNCHIGLINNNRNQYRMRAYENFSPYRGVNKVLGVLEKS